MSLFICHASEDKEDFVEHLVSELQGVNLFYDKYSLMSGDFIGATIHEAISESSGAVVIISENFIGKTYPENELKLILSKLLKEDNYKFFPISLEVGVEKIKGRYKLFDDVWCQEFERSREGAESLARQILDGVGIPSQDNVQRSIDLSFKEVKGSLLKVKDYNEIISKRYGIESELHTLESIGQELFLTRERIRQREKTAKNKLIKLFEKDRLLSSIKDYIFSFVVDNNENELVSYYSVLSNVKVAENDTYNISQFIKMVLDLFGFKEIKNAYDFNIVYVRNHDDLRSLEREVRYLFSYMKDVNSRWLSVDEIKKELNLVIEIDLLPVFLEFSEIIEKENKMYRVKKEMLGSFASIAERIIIESGGPIASKVLLENMRLFVLNHPQIKNKFNKRLALQQMVAAKGRLFSNRVGMWATREFKEKVTQSIDVLENLLIKNKYPMNKQDIEKELRAFGLSEKNLKSCNTYLNTNPKFLPLENFTGEKYFTVSNAIYDEKEFKPRKYKKRKNLKEVSKIR